MTRSIVAHRYGARALALALALVRVHLPGWWVAAPGAAAIVGAAVRWALGPDRATLVMLMLHAPLAIGLYWCAPAHAAPRAWRDRLLLAGILPGSVACCSVLNGLFVTGIHVCLAMAGDLLQQPGLPPVPIVSYDEPPTPVPSPPPSGWSSPDTDDAMRPHRYSPPPRDRYYLW